MSLLNKLTRALRWLRWSTVCAILFYVFFIGLILHSTTYKLQHTLKSSQHHHGGQQMPHELETEPRSTGIGYHSAQLQGTSDSSSSSLSLSLSSSSATRNNVLHLPFGAKALGEGEEVGGGFGRNPVESSVAMKDGAFLAAGSRHRTGAKIPSSSSSLKSLSSLSSSSTKDAEMRAKFEGNGNHGTGKRKQLQQHAAVEPETVIIAASSVNEKQILEKALRRADRNHDNHLTIQELALYINKKIVDHIDEAIDMNPREFRRVDISPADGVITWDEYHRFFLKSHGMTDDDIDEHDEIKHTALNRKAREDMMRDKARWSEAARTDLFSLTIDEYLSFRHPESSVSNLLELVDDLLRQFDQDGDDQLTIEEFSELNMDDDDDLMRKSLISKTVVERREEFKRIIDKNKDGKADRGELLHYVNPRTPRYALQEAATIFSLCDENHDGKLNLEEMAANAEIILTSKMIDTANSFHTEF